ncbi:MAG: CotH kinase family protein [Cellvibrionaceae bacterium]|nr:CotH kinase family protein [Cellvibrionaceae bacterium]
MSSSLSVFGLMLIGMALVACSNGGSGGGATSASSSSSSSSSSSAGFVGPDPDWFPEGVATHLPQIRITTVTPILTKEDYVEGTFEVEDEAGAVTASGELEIRGRGNSSWDWPKRPFRVKLEESTELLGMPASRHWVLLANYADKTLIRNDVAFTFSRQLGMEYTVRDRHVELTINDQYRGIYQLVEQIRLAKDRLDVPDLEVIDVEEPDITGGYLIEADFRMTQNYCENPFVWSFSPFCDGPVNTDREKTFCVDSQYGMAPLCLKEPDNLLAEEWAFQRDYIEQYLRDTESALFGANFADPELGYAAYIDVDSAVNYYIINEFFKNPDGGSASFFMYKKRDGKLYFGPIWDFDLTMGNNGQEGLIDPRGWWVRQATWFTRLFADPAFANKVVARWNELKEQGTFYHLLGYAERRANWLSVKQVDNFDVWSRVWGECAWFTRLVPRSYEAEVQEMLLWQQYRYDWMDRVLNGTLNPSFTPDRSRCAISDDIDWTVPFIGEQEEEVEP